MRQGNLHGDTVEIGRDTRKFRPQEVVTVETRDRSPTENGNLSPQCPCTSLPQLNTLSRNSPY